MAWKDWFKRGSGRSTPVRQGQDGPVGSIETFSQNDLDKHKSIQLSYIQESNMSGGNPVSRLISAGLSKIPLRKWAGRETALQSDLMSTWTKAVNDRRSYLQVVEELERYYMADLILETIVEDSLNPDMNGDIFEFTSENEALKKVLDEFSKQHNLQNFLYSIAYDTVNMGEYTVRVVIDENRQEGVKAICDDLNQLGILALYEKGVPSGFMIMEHSDYKMLAPNAYVHFVTGYNKMRIRLDAAIGEVEYQIDFDNVSPELKEKIPDYVRVGKPFFYSTFEKIRELQIMEKLTVALKLNQITQSKYISLRVPASMTPAKVSEALADMEATLNSQVGVDIESGNLTIADIMTQAGHFKVIPNFSDEKGTLETLNVKDEKSVDDILNSTESLRQILLSTCGIPYSVIFGPEKGSGTGNGEGNRASEIRRFGRYARKLAGIQRAMARGLKQLALIHLVNYENNKFNVTMDSFDLVFKNQMVDMSALEKMEYDDFKQEIVGRKLDFLLKMESVEFVKANMNHANCIAWLEESFNDLTQGINLFFTEGEKEDLAAVLDSDDEVRDSFLSVIKGEFMTRRQQRAKEFAGMLRQELDGEAEEEDLEQTLKKADLFMTKLKDSFAKRAKAKFKRAGIELPIKTADGSEGGTLKTDVHGSVVKNFQQLRDQRTKNSDVSQ